MESGDGMGGEGGESEVPGREVRGDVVDELDLVRPPPVAVRALAPQRRHLVVLAAEDHGDGAVLDPRRDHLAKEGDDLFGASVGADVPVLRGAPAAEIAHAAADDPSALALLAQATANPEDVLGHEIDQVAKL